MFQYEVYFHDESEERERTACGIVGAANYGNAARRVTEFYGGDNIITMKLMELYDIMEIDELEEVIESCDM